jgi:hypothetical protein
MVTWSKAYARHYEVRVSTDGETWDVAKEAGPKRGMFGDSDIVTFWPQRARYVRLLLVSPGTDWGGYSVFNLGVFESTPERRGLRESIR